MLLGLAIVLGTVLTGGIILITLRCRKCDKNQIKEWQRNGTIKGAIKCVAKEGSKYTFEEIEKSGGKIRQYEVTQDENLNFSEEVKKGEIYNFC